MSEQDRYQALRASRLAAEFTDEQCRTLADKIELRDLANGEVLVKEGAPDDRLFVIVSGALGVVRHPQGEPPVPLHTLVAGDFAGELSFIDGTVRYASLAIVKEAMGAGQTIRRHIPPALFLLALVAMLLAAARPVAVVTLPFFWSGAPATLGACAAWLGGLARGSHPQSGAARGFGVVGLVIAVLVIVATVFGGAAGALFG